MPRSGAREGSTDSTGGGLTLGVDGARGRRGGDQARARARTREGVPFWHNPEGLASIYLAHATGEISHDYRPTAHRFAEVGCDGARLVTLGSDLLDAAQGTFKRELGARRTFD